MSEHPQVWFMCTWLLPFKNHDPPVDTKQMENTKWKSIVMLNTAEFC